MRLINRLLAAVLAAAIIAAGLLVVVEVIADRITGHAALVQTGTRFMSGPHAPAGCKAASEWGPSSSPRLA